MIEQFDNTVPVIVRKPNEPNLIKVTNVTGSVSGGGGVTLDANNFLRKNGDLTQYVLDLPFYDASGNLLINIDTSTATMRNMVANWPLYRPSGTTGQISLKFDASTLSVDASKGLVVIGGGNGGSASIEGAKFELSVIQAGHGLSVGNIIRMSGPNTFAKAKADTKSNAEVIGYVTEVVDVNIFKYATTGYVTTGVPNHTAGSVMFLSDVTAGALTPNELTTLGHINKPVLIIIESGLKAQFINMRGNVIGNTVSGGVIGPQGNQGDIGAQGSQGPQGPQGYQGISGSQGVQGTQGTQGYRGYQGYTGSQGNQGYQGAQGYQGDQGTQGVQGTQGTQGTQGYQGYQGAQGRQGTQGPQGNQGYQGYRGYQGYTGYQGYQGATGYQGYQGSQGSNGEITKEYADASLAYKFSTFSFKTSAYEASIGDHNNIIDASGTFTVTFGSGLPTGFSTTVINSGPGTITLNASTFLATDSSLALRDRYAAASVVHKGSGVFYAFGNLK